MKLSWIDILLILFGLFIAYQLIRAIIGGSWQTEGLIIAMLMFNLGLLWKVGMSLVDIRIKFDRHIGWHRARDKK